MTHPTPTGPGPTGPTQPTPPTRTRGGPWPSGPAPTGPSGPTGPGRAAQQARYDAAIELQAAINGVRELASVGRSSEPVRVRLIEAQYAWDRLNGRRWRS